VKTRLYTAVKSMPAWAAAVRCKNAIKARVGRTGVFLRRWKAIGEILRQCLVKKHSLPSAHTPLVQKVRLRGAHPVGILGRKHDGHPGMIALWRGLQRLHDIATAWQIFTQAQKVVGNA
jgi:hypothetical protein